MLRHIILALATLYTATNATQLTTQDDEACAQALSYSSFDCSKDFISCVNLLLKNTDCGYHLVKHEQK